MTRAVLAGYEASPSGKHDPFGSVMSPLVPKSLSPAWRTKRFTEDHSGISHASTSRSTGSEKIRWVSATPNSNVVTFATHSSFHVNFLSRKNLFLAWIWCSEVASLMPNSFGSKKLLRAFRNRVFSRSSLVTIVWAIFHERRDFFSTI